MLILFSCSSALKKPKNWNIDNPDVVHVDTLSLIDFVNYY